jgi:hypothetical protein
MTSLRTFQTEIDEIHIREVAKQRTHAFQVDEREKENKNPQPKGKHTKEDSVKVGGAGLEEVEEDIQARAICFIGHSPP